MTELERAAEILRQADSVLFVTGAGLSADSGLPTYRGVGGLYSSGTTDEGVPIETALSGHMLLERPELCWKHIAAIELACRGATFNAGHAAIAAIEQRKDRVWVLTQNVDGFHTDAGSDHVIEIHGNIHTLLCTVCRHRWFVEDYSRLEVIPPRCGRCSGLVRPAVVLFDEWLPQAEVSLLQRELATGFDAVFSVGTSSGFPYIAGPVLDQVRRGLPAVELNPGDTAVSASVSVHCRGGAAADLQALVQAL